MDEASKQLVAWFDQVETSGGVVVALSGGVDSTVVAAAAARSRCHTLAVTAHSPAVPQWQRQLAADIADQLRVDHQCVDTDELDLLEYQRNDSDRCFFCKQTLYHFMAPIAQDRDATLVSGTNADDLGDHRPGIEAGRQAGVRMPLAELNLGKADVRRIAAEWSLSNADLPASPCLASRIAYGVEVTPERLHRIELAEAWLRQRGMRDLRVRLHGDELARIEVPSDRLGDVIAWSQHEDLVAEFKKMGFRYVSLDLGGLRSGSLNDGLITIPKPSMVETASHE